MQAKIEVLRGEGIRLTSVVAVGGLQSLTTAGVWTFSYDRGAV
jgi:hypothetical protein